MDTKEQLIQELDNISEPVLMEVLDFLQFLKAKAEQERLEDEEDLADVRVALAEIESEGTISWDELKAETIYCCMSDIE
jgi:hypothetical protein